MPLKYFDDDDDAVMDGPMIASSSDRSSVMSPSSASESSNSYSRKSPRPLAAAEVVAGGIDGYTCGASVSSVNACFGFLDVDDARECDFFFSRVATFEFFSICNCFSVARKRFSNVELNDGPVEDECEDA